MNQFFWGLWLAAAPLAVAQQPAPSGSAKPLTLSEVLALADRYNPQLRAANAQRQGAEAAITTASAHPNPHVNVLSSPQFSLPYIKGPGPAGLLQHYSFEQS